MIINGICCEYCKYIDTIVCPVKDGDPWSRHSCFCHKYEPNKKHYPDEAKSFDEVSMVKAK